MSQLLFLEGFEAYDTSSVGSTMRTGDVAGKWFSAEGYITIGYGRRVGQAGKLISWESFTATYTQSTVTADLKKNVSNLLVMFNFKTNVASTGEIDDRTIVQFKDSASSDQITAIMAADNSAITIYRGSNSAGTAIQTLTYAFAANTWYCVSMKILFDNSGLIRTIIKLDDGTAVVDVSNSVDTTNTANANCRKVKFYSGIANMSVQETITLDHVAMFEVDANENFLDPHNRIVETLFPTANVYTGSWSQSGGGSHYDKIDEKILDTADYIVATGVDPYSYNTNSALASGVTGFLSGVQINYNTKQIAGSGLIIGGFMYIGDTFCWTNHTSSGVYTPTATGLTFHNQYIREPYSSGFFLLAGFNSSGPHTPTIKTIQNWS